MMRSVIQQCLANSKRILTAGFVGLTLTALAAPDSVPAKWQPTYDQGVDAYRNGEYQKAYKEFDALTLEVPESIEGRYYYAITLAQLGRFKEAKVAYENVIRLAPNTEAAQLAQEGLESLPELNRLDAPPQFQKKAQAAPPVPQQAALLPGEQAMPGQPQPAPASPFGNIDPQMMMMMMGAMGGGGGGGGGFNPMMIPMMQSMTQGKGGGDNQPALPPDAFSNMMMNQMMQNFDPFSSGKDD
jgi:tetratricopeptide (TPR) repeat protein